MQLYDILKAGKTDKAPDSRTLLLARKLFPPPNSGLPVTRGLRSVLHLADFDAQKSTWTDTTFGKVIYRSKRISPELRRMHERQRAAFQRFQLQH